MSQRVWINKNNNFEIGWSFVCLVDWTFDDSTRSENVKKTNKEIDAEINIKINV